MIVHAPNKTNMARFYSARLLPPLGGKGGGGAVLLNEITANMHED